MLLLLPAPLRAGARRGGRRARPDPGLHQGQLGQGPLAQARRRLWSYIAPVLVLAAFAPGPPELSSRRLLCARIHRPGRHRLRSDGPPQPAPRPRCRFRELARTLRGRRPGSSRSSPRSPSWSTLAAYERASWWLLAIAPLVWLLDNLLAGPRGALRRRARAQPRVPRHGDAAVRRARVRGRVHRAALALGRRPGQRGSGRARASSRTSGRSSSSPRCSTTSARSRSPRRSSTSRRRSPSASSR